ncbi:MAG: NAD(P)/FAD-dependent oxidoreductase [Beijerinckiaceae bacterium]
MAATRKGDLREGTSLWQGLNRPRLGEQPLKRDHITDVLVIGAGISGALIAESLSEEGLAVTIVDRRGPLKGSTPASTALLQYEIDEPLTALYDKMGKARAQRIYRRSRLAVDALRERTRRLGIAADCINRDSLYIEGNELNADDLLEEAKARQEAGFEVSFLTRREVAERFGIKKRAALMGRDNMSADPVKLAGGFLRTAMARGTKLFAPVEVTDVQAGARGVRAQTKDGPMIRASHVIFATGYEFPKYVPQKGHKIASTWALATRPQPRNIWPESVFIWEAADPYLYLRAGPNGEIICGGEDEDFQNEDIRNALMDIKIETIESKLKQLFPHVDARAAYAWCGSFGTSKTGTPSIGPIPKMKNCYAVMGFGGNGITFSMMAAQMLRGMICGQGDPDLDLVSFNRKF